MVVTLFLEFGPSTVCFFFPFGKVQKTGNEQRMKERLMTSGEVSLITQPLLPLLLATSH